MADDPVVVIVVGIGPVVDTDVTIVVADGLGDAVDSSSVPPNPDAVARVVVSHAAPRKFHTDSEPASQPNPLALSSPLIPTATQPMQLFDLSRPAPMKKPMSLNA